MRIVTRVEEKLRHAIQMLEKRFPGMGLVILTFEQGLDKPKVGYISNSKREDMRRALREQLEKWDADARGAPHWPLTVEAFDTWLITYGRNGEDPRDAIQRYVKFSNQGTGV